MALRLFAAWPAAIAAVDISEAVDACKSLVDGRATVTFAQADLNSLPFADGQFDVVWSSGVLHHTPDTFAALRSVARHARPGEDGRFIKVVGVLAVLAVYALVLEPVGYPIATFVLVLFMLRVTDPQRWPVAFGMGLLAAGGSYVLFGVWLGVPLPAGVLAR